MTSHRSLGLAKSSASVAVAERLHTLEAENAVLRQTSAMHNELIQMVLEGRGVDSIADRLSALIGNPVAIADYLFHLIASSPRGEHGDRHRRESIVRGGTAREVLDDPLVGGHFKMVAEQKRPILFPPFPDHGMDQRRLMAPILAGDEILGYVTVLEAGEVLQDFHATVLQQAALILALELMKQRVALETEQRLFTDFLSDLLSGRYESRDIVVSRAGFLGIDLFRHWMLLIVDVDDVSALREASRAPNTLAARYYLFEIVRRVVRRDFPASIVIVQRDSIVIIYPAMPDTDRAERGMRALTALIRHQVHLAWSAVTVSIAIGGVCTCLEDFGTRYTEARRALDVIRGMHKHDEVITLEELGIYGLLFRREDHEHLMQFVERLLGPLVAYDRKHHTNLVETLEIFLNENGGIRSTARRLPVHINTLRGRLDRISQLCHVDLHDAKARLNLQIALEIHRLAQAE